MMMLNPVEHENCVKTIDKNFVHFVRLWVRYTDKSPCGSIVTKKKK